MKRPYIIVQVSSSVDGRISFGPNRTQFDDMYDSRGDLVDREIWNRVEERIKFVHQPQVDMLGSRSLVKEGVKLKELPVFTGNVAELYRDYLPEDVIRRSDHQGWLIIVDGRGRVRSGFKGTDDRPGWHALHLVSRGVAPEYLAFLQTEKIPYIITGDKRVNLPLAMEKMKTKLDVNCLVTTSAGRLGGALLRANLIDELYVIFRPEIYGGFETPSLFDSSELAEDQMPTKLNLVDAQFQHNGNILLHYKVD